MARSMHIYTIENVAAMIGENLELLREISANSDNIDYGKWCTSTTRQKMAQPASRTEASNAPSNS
ncbi:hypothetical protein NXC12_PD00063 (plasmid) [Rhizobium etli]|uniref:Uncharacterized protein n=1 Tax=Rhizobium etli TaxID=29449 RepID=A0AAN1BKY7_RHIET|nr:hypothetical protein [Rhizobium etli]ARQ13174.1 hypothetical protein NXC12_PD00063 [Rhizobium etli]